MRLMREETKSTGSKTPGPRDALIVGSCASCQLTVSRWQMDPQESIDMGWKRVSPSPIPSPNAPNPGPTSSTGRGT